MLPFIRKKNNGTEAEKTPASPAPVVRTEPPPPSSRTTTPGVQMLKEVWHIETGKKKKEMPPPNVPTDIYAVPKQRQVPRRNGGNID